MQQNPNQGVRPSSLQVLICTYNRAELLQRTLAYLNQATRPPETEISIVVAVNACTDNTIELLQRYQDEQATSGAIALNWVNVVTPGKSHALNEAIPTLTSEVIAFVDDDHRVDERYFEATLDACAAHPATPMFCGKILPDWTGAEPGWVHDAGPYRIYPLPIPHFDQGEECIPIGESTRIPGGGNLFVRREVFAQIGEFALDFGPVGHDLGGAEDIEWVKRALAMGLSVLYIPQVIQYHYVDSERLRLGYLMSKAYERTISMMRLSDDVAPKQRVPLYMYRKFFGYVFNAVFCLTGRRRRFYLVRSAASAGEIRGFRQRRDELLARGGSSERGG